MGTPPLSVAPMIDRTDRHFRWFMRQITRHTLLYTQMLVSHAVLYGDRAYLLGFDPAEHPIALQLAGTDAAELAQCARIGADLGYDEINLNVGCPSARVGRAGFGAGLMRTPERVAESVAAIVAAVDIPVTVKHRIGVDELDRYEDMLAFVDCVAAAGPARFTVHARKAWLSGMTPTENRTIPPLRYHDVRRLKAERPELSIEINGGIRTIEEVQGHLAHVDACMIGRAAWDEPWLFADADRCIFGSTAAAPTRDGVIAAMLDYLATKRTTPFRSHLVIRAMMNRFAGEPGSEAWKWALSANAHFGADAIRTARTAQQEACRS